MELRPDRLSSPSVTPADAVGARAKLIAILRLAYSGERAAAFAYQGHAASVKDPAEREHISVIEREELEHRELVGRMLQALGAKPRRRDERRATLIGRTLGALCHVTGRFLPMYGAGKLESRNIREYETAARLARDCGREEWVDCLLAMAEVEWEHESWFRVRVLAHPLVSHRWIWPAPPPKSTIRAGWALVPRESDDTVPESFLSDARVPASAPRSR